MPVDPPWPSVARRQPKRRGVARWIGRIVGAAALLAGAALVGQTWRSGELRPALESARAWLIARSAEAGFTVQDVEVAGRIQTDPKALLAAAGLARGTPILEVDPEAARLRIETLPWVKTASVERRLPDTITIEIEERSPIALWQHNGKISLIDAEGANLGQVAIESAPALPLVVGGDAAGHAAELLALLANHPDLGRRVQASSWIGSRRWDLKLDNGVDVRLPETGVAEALQQLADAEASSRLFERDVAAIDLRLAGKMIVRLTHEPPPPAKTKPQQGI